MQQNLGICIIQALEKDKISARVLTVLRIVFR